MQDKNQFNEQGERNGYWEMTGMSFYENNKIYQGIRHKGYYVNGVDYGFWIERGNEKIYYAR
jgi:hypothetical protein